MSEVEMEADGADGELKPISEYTATPSTSNLKEFAAVTPVCNAATRFLAVDLLGDIAAGYRNAYDKMKAQLFIARLQQAINATGNQVVYTRTTAITGLASWVSLWAKISELVGEGGTFVFNYTTKGQIITDAIASGLDTLATQAMLSGDLSPILGKPAIIVPDDLMPSLNSTGTKSFVVEGVTVTINQGVFYLPLNVFTGRTSGGLQYDLSTDASYEENSVVKSAFQRNELVVRGSGFRGGAVKDTAKVASMAAAGIS